MDVVWVLWAFLCQRCCTEWRQLSSAPSSPDTQPPPRSLPDLCQKPVSTSLHVNPAHLFSCQPPLHTYTFCSAPASSQKAPRPLPSPVNHNGVLNFSPAQSSWCHDTWTSLSVVVFRDVQTQLYCGLAIRFNLSTTWMSFSSTNVSP